MTIHRPTVRVGGQSAVVGAALAVFLSSVHLALGLGAGFGGPPSPTGRPADARPAVARIDDVVEQVRASNEAVALAGAVVTDRGVVAVGVAGVRAAGSQARVEVDDRFHLGSCTKSMTATLCAILVERGVLSWSTTIGEVFADLKGKIDPAYLPVTLEQLVCHRGGLPEDRKPGLIFFKVLAMEGETAEKRRESVKLLLGQAPGPAPGSAFAYSNAGFVIAGAMAERATGRSWEALMTEHLFQPLAMGSAGFGTPGSADKIDQPRGHKRGLFGGRNAVVPGPFGDNPDVFGPAGRVHCSLEDWGKYAALHLAGAHRDTGLLPRSAFQKLHSAPFDRHYGFGWGRGRPAWAGGTVLQHAGSNTMWYAQIHLDMASRVGYLAAANHGDDEAVAAVSELLAALAEWAKAHGIGE